MSEADRPNITHIAIAFEGSVVVVAWGLGWVVGHSPTSQIHLTWGALFWGTIGTLPLLLFSWWCLHSSWQPLIRLVGTVEESVVPMFQGSSAFSLALISILAGVGEEALFRGVLQNVFAGWLGVPGALVSTSVLFGLAHWVTSGYAIMAGIIGLYLGGIALTQQNLAVAIVIHALYDFVALSYLIPRIGRRTHETSTAAAS